MSLVAQEFNGEGSLIIEAGTVVSANGWRVFRNRPSVATLRADVGCLEALPTDEVRPHPWSRADRAGEIRLRQDLVTVPPPPRNQLFVVMMRRGRNRAIVIESASAMATNAQWVFLSVHGQVMAALPAADVSHVETVRDAPEGRRVEVSTGIA